MNLHAFIISNTDFSSACVLNVANVGNCEQCLAGVPPSDLQQLTNRISLHYIFFLIFSLFLSLSLLSFTFCLSSFVHFLSYCLNTRRKEERNSLRGSLRKFSVRARISFQKVASRYIPVFETWFYTFLLTNASCFWLVLKKVSYIKDKSEQLTLELSLHRRAKRS